MSCVSEGMGAALLGLVQGLTEFLPVSSSGHLVLFQQFLELGEEAIFFDLALHMGTLFVVLWFYRTDIRSILTDWVSGEAPWSERPGVRLSGLIVVASIPTGLIGLTLEDQFEAWFANPPVLTLTFAITALVLFASNWAPEGQTDERQMRWWHALVLGLVQGLAITPGISRSGSTIVAAMFLGLNREYAARFSFLMSVPAIFGATMWTARKVSPQAVDWPSVGLGMAVAMVSGYVALIVLVKLVKKGRLSPFAWYCGLASLVAGGISYWG
jgi:undecaprenyl-diphosphatase